MAVVSTVSNHFKYQVMKSEIDFSTDEFRTILMQDSFAFDKDAHATYLLVSGEEIPTGNGYTARGIELLSGELTEDDTNDKGSMVWSYNPTWTATGGSIGPAGAAVVFDETSSDDTVIGCIDFGADYTATEGLSIQVQSGELTLA
jgi:hypothetical protein